MGTDGPGYPQQDPGWQGGQAAPGWSGGGSAPQQTNGLAIGALVSSILGFFCGIGFVVGLILGYNARNQIRQSGGTQGGEGAATAAIVIGWIGIGLTILGTLAFILFFGAFATTAPSL